MAGDSSEIQALQQQMAELTRRVFALERAIEHRLNIRLEGGEAPREAAPVVHARPPAAEPGAVAPIPPLVTPRPPASFSNSRSEPSAPPRTRSSELNLEKKIGQYWLNRIG